MQESLRNYFERQPPRKELYSQAARQDNLGYQASRGNGSHCPRGTTSARSLLSLPGGETFGAGEARRL